MATTKQDLMVLRQKVRDADQRYDAARQTNLTGKTAEQLVDLDIATQVALTALVAANDIYRDALIRFVEAEAA